MYLERLLQINMAALAALGALLLGMGQQDAGIPLLMLIAAMASVWLTDVTGWFRLNRTVANLMALAAVLWVVKDLDALAGITQVLFIARLLVYLQVVLLFQEKDTRAYWQLGMVSLLQVVVAAAFHQGAWFGLLLALYLLVALSAMALFFLHRERAGYDRPREPAPPRPLREAAAWIAAWIAAARTARGPRPADGRRPGASASPPASAPRRWPLDPRPSAFAGSASPARAGVGAELLVRLGAMAAATLALTVVLFFTVPRTGGSAWRGAGVAPRHAVGFSDRVTLGELGRIIQKPDEVMRVRFYRAGGEPYPVRGTVYFRGAVLNHYENGQWRYAASRTARRAAPVPPAGLPSDREAVRQEIAIEPMDREELFCVWPFAVTDSGPRLLMDHSHQRLLRPREFCLTRFNYELMTTAFENGEQAPLCPEPGIIDPAAMLQMPRRNGESALPGLEALAAQWVRESGLPADDPLAIALMLEERLAASDRFQYSLQGQARDPAVDPLEDFVANNPRGHCEYFATALALMLRSQGVPSRVIVGYSCDEWNQLGRFYQVRQWHAHTWVEAYLEPEHVPKRLVRGDHPWEWSAGAWLRLDPTPGGPGGDAAASLSALERLRRSVQSVWADYVMEMDRLRQREAIYRPLLDWLQGAWQRISDPAWWCGLLAGTWQAVRQFFAEWLRGNWFSWRGFVVVFVLGLALGGAVRLGQWTVRRLARRRTARSGAGARGRPAPVAFYRRLETVLARRGLVRLPAQTQREFARAAGPALAALVGVEDVAGLPARVAEAFYRVRFGGAALDNLQAQEVEHALAALEEAASLAARS